MINKEKSIIFDIDGTICPEKGEGEDYELLQPYPEMLERLREYKDLGFYIIFATARNMRTHNGNIGKLNAQTLKVLLNWLDEHGIPYDEIHVGKPWPGVGGFYVDDKAIRPSEFRSLSYDGITELLAEERRKSGVK